MRYRITLAVYHPKILVFKIKNRSVSRIVLADSNLRRPTSILSESDKFVEVLTADTPRFPKFDPSVTPDRLILFKKPKEYAR